DSRRSVNRRDRRTAVVSSSLVDGVQEPTALMCVPSAIQAPCRTGDGEDVTVQTISELQTACWAAPAIWKGISYWDSRRRARFSACDALRPQSVIRERC